MEKDKRFKKVILYLFPLPLILFFCSPFGLSLEKRIKNAFIYIQERNYLYVTNKDEILTNDTFIRSRESASIIEVNDFLYLYYLKTRREDKESSINLRILSKGNNNFNSEFFIDDSPIVFDRSLDDYMIYNPYVFLEGSTYYMIFTTFKISESYTKGFSEIRIAKSNDGKNWEVNNEPILTPKFDWEQSSIWNWGLIKKADTFYLSYFSGLNGIKNERKLAIAYSKDLQEWTRLKYEPLIGTNKHSSAFFEYNGFIYALVSSTGVFEVYKFDDFNNFNSQSLLGYWAPLGKRNLASLYMPYILTPDATKEIYPESQFLITYSVYKDGKVTKIQVFKNTDSFLEKIISKN